MQTDAVYPHMQNTVSLIKASLLTFDRQKYCNQESFFMNKTLKLVMPYTIDVILIRLLLVCEVLHIDPAFLLCAKFALRGQQLM